MADRVWVQVGDRAPADPRRAQAAPPGEPIRPTRLRRPTPGARVEAAPHPRRPPVPAADEARRLAQPRCLAAQNSDRKANMVPSATLRQLSQHVSGSGTQRGRTGERWTIDVVICPSAKNRSTTSVSSSVSAACTFIRMFSSPVTR